MAGIPAETLGTVAKRTARAPLPPAERGELTGLLVVLQELAAHLATESREQIRGRLGLA
jgi:hypothetical protein